MHVLTSKNVIENPGESVGAAKPSPRVDYHRRLYQVYVGRLIDCRRRTNIRTCQIINTNTDVKILRSWWVVGKACKAGITR